MDKQVNSVVQSCFFHLRQIAKVKPFLIFSDTQKIIHALIFSRLDYCNSLYCDINKSILDRLQLVQNAAARLLTRTRKYEHITPIVADACFEFELRQVISLSSILFLKINFIHHHF